MRKQTAKKLSEPAWDALTDALATFQWYKQPFETLVRLRFSDVPEIVNRLTFDVPKRRVAGELVAALRMQESRYQAVVIDALVSLAEYDDTFPHLARLEGGAEKVAVAQEALDRVRSVIQQYSDLAAARARVREEFEGRSSGDAARRSHAAVLADLHSQFLAMWGATDPQQRGRDLESFLNKLFDLWDLFPRSAYNLQHEQIDGAFTFRTDDYLLEARWWNEPLGPKELNDFKAKVDSKARNTLGLCVAVAGFTEGAIANHSRSQTPLVLMDGVDLMPILEGRIGLDEVLERKRRHAAETGDPMYRAVPGPP